MTAAGVNANLPLNMRIRRGTASFMNQWMSSAGTDTTTDFKSPTDTAPQEYKLLLNGLQVYFYPANETTGRILQ